MSIKTKLTVLFIALAILPMFFLGAISLSNFQKALIDETLLRLVAISAIHKERIGSYIKISFERLGNITSRLQIKIETARFIEDENEESRIFLINTLKSTQKEIPGTISVSIVGLNGQVIASTDQNSINQPLKSKQVFDRGLIKNEVAILEKQANGYISIYQTGPLIDNNNRPFAVVVIKSSSDGLFDLFKENTGLGTTGEIILAKRNEFGDGVIINPLRFDQNAPLTRIIDKNNKSRPITKALDKIEGIFADTLDYRGKEVYSSTRYLQDLDWGFAAKIDKSEVLAPVISLRKSFTALLIIVSLICAVLAYLTAKNLSDPIKELTLVAAEISKNRFISSTIDIPTNDEIGHLSRSFNQMNKKLNKSYQLLEEKVLQRTKDLQKFKLAVEGSSDHITISDKEGNILYANPAVTRLTGFTTAEVLGKKAGGSNLWGGFMSKSFYERLWQTIKENKKVFTGEFTIKKKDGKKIYSKATIYPILDEKRDVEFFVEIHRNISRDKEIDRLKDEFVAIISHELRSPLAAIRGNMELIYTGVFGKIPKKVGVFAKNTHDTARTLIHLVNQYLDISRLSLDKIKFNFQKVDLKKFTVEIVKELKILADKKGLKITVSSPPKDLQKVKADPEQLSHIITNLLENSIRYTQKGEINLSFKALAGFTEIRITDTGVGIPEEKKHLIFQKFQTAHKEILTMPAGSSGLGLFITKSLVEKQGGFIYLIESKVGIGSTFAFVLPVWPKS